MAPRPTGGVPPTPYYMFLSVKKKDSFLLFVKFVRKCFHRVQRDTQRPQQREENIRPEIPKRTQGGGEAEKKERASADGGEEHIKPQLAAADTQREKIEAQREGEGVERVQRGGERAPTAQAHRAEKIV